MRSQCKQGKKPKDSTAQAMDVEEEGDVETESEATFAAAVKRAPNFDLSKLVHSVLLYVTFTVIKGARSTGDKVRRKTAEIIDMILDGFHNRQGIAVMPIKATDKDTIITSGFQLPQKFSKIRRFVAYVNPNNDFTRNITGDKGKEFNAIMRFATDINIMAGLGDAILDFAIAGVKVEVKRFQVVRSRNDLLMSHIPRDVALNYVKEGPEVHRGRQERLLLHCA